MVGNLGSLTHGMGTFVWITPKILNPPEPSEPGLPSLLKASTSISYSHGLSSARQQRLPQDLPLLSLLALRPIIKIKSQYSQSNDILDLAKKGKKDHTTKELQELVSMYWQDTGKVLDQNG